MVGGVSLVVQYWADLQSVQGFRCYDNVARTRNVSKCSVLALCLVRFVVYVLRDKLYSTFTAKLEQIEQAGLHIYTKWRSVIVALL